MNELDELKRFRDDVPEPSTDAWLRARAAIAAVRAEASESPEQQPSKRRGSRGPQRRLAVLAIGIAVVAATFGVVLTLETQGARSPVPRSHLGGPNAARPNASVIRARLIDALSGDKDTIFYTQSSTQVPGQPASSGQEWDYPWNGRPGQIVRQAGTDSVGGTVLGTWSLTFTVPAGATSKAAESPGAACNVAGQRIDVDFTDQTWQPSQQSCVALTPGLDTASFVDPTTHQLISNIITLEADGLLQVVGYPTVDDQPTVELKSDTQGANTLDLWVNDRTYLPVQSVSTSPTGDPDPGKTLTTVDHYSFLNPTQANLANLHVTVPTGFTEIVSPEKG